MSTKDTGVSTKNMVYVDNVHVVHDASIFAIILQHSRKDLFCVRQSRMCKISCGKAACKAVAAQPQQKSYR
jgi:hypothetical protein